MWEEHGKGRIGIEAYHTGRQLLGDNPLRTRSRPNLHLGVLGEIVFGRFSLFANAENLLTCASRAPIRCCVLSARRAVNGPSTHGHR